MLLPFNGRREFQQSTGCYPEEHWMLSPRIMGTLSSGFEFLALVNFIASG